VDAMRGELVAELDNGLYGIGLRRGCPGVARRRAVCELARREKARPRQGLDFRPVEQPVPTSEIDLLIARAEDARQDRLRWRVYS
jgi:hypothetical protein